MRRSSLKSEDRNTDSSQMSTPLSLASTSIEGFESPEWEMASPGAAYIAEDTGFPTEFSADLVPAEGFSVSHKEIEADSRRQTTALSPNTESAVGRILPDALECQYGGRDPEENTAPASRSDSHSCQGKQEVYPRVCDQDCVKAGPVATSYSKTLGGTDEAVASPVSSSIINVEPTEAGDYTDTHEEVAFSSRTDKRTSVRASLPKGQDHPPSRFDRPEVSTRPAVLGQNDGTIGSETAPTSLKGHECGERSWPPKRSFGWRLRKRGPAKMEATSTVTSQEGHSEAGTSGGASRKRSALTSYRHKAPDELDTASCALSPTPSPVSTSTGRSSRHSWTSVLSKTPGGRKIPMASTFFALLRRSSNSPSPEKQAPKCPGRLSIASDIEWDCDEPEPEKRSLGRPGTPVDSSAGTERKNVYSRDEVDDTSLLQVEEISLTADPDKSKHSRNALEMTMGSRI